MIASPAYAGAESGFYVGAGVGQGSIDADFDGGGDFDSDDTGYKLIGGYNFGIIPLVDLAAEIAYVDLGKPDDGGVEVDASAIAAFGLVGVNLGPIGVFGKVGVASWDADVSGTLGSASDDGEDPVYGAGLRFQIASFQIRAEYEFFDLDDVDADFLSASLLYTF
jgi:opacity protein-like surface antigen